MPEAPQTAVNGIDSTERQTIPRSERLIVALDVPGNEAALRIVEQLGDAVQFYKIGLELIFAGGYIELVDELVEKGKKIMLDGKIFDIAATARAAVAQAAKHNVTFVTVHGNDEMLKAAVEARRDTKILAVTVLTSLDNDDMRALGFEADIQQVVLSRARRALDIGCQGIVSSGLEASALRKTYGHGFLIVVPGIRPGSNQDDQKRTVDVEEAFQNGADYIVVGRPIRDEANPREAALSIQRRIAKLFP